MILQRSKKIISIVMCICMLFSMFPMTIIAEDTVQSYIFDGNDSTSPSVYELTCDCELVDGQHFENCVLNNQRECVCDSEIHSEDCPLYDGLEEDTEIIECTCGLEGHSADCFLYEKPVELSFEMLMNSTTLSELNIVFEVENYIDFISNLENNQKIDLLDKVELLYSDIESPTEEEINLRNRLVNLLNRFIIVICSECGAEAGEHL